MLFTNSRNSSSTGIESLFPKLRSDKSLIYTFNDEKGADIFFDRIDEKNTTIIDEK